ncbi:MAG: chromosomal replication initiator protein DnaA [Anaerolineae bacterium]|nr:chromosomal replication initiator protein DnaA [Anaerolineae bacterium]
MKPQDAWQATLGQLQLQMDKATFDTWLRGAEVSDFQRAQDGAAAFTISVRNAYAKDWLEQRLAPSITRTLSEIFGQPAQVAFTVWRANGSPELALDAPPHANGNGAGANGHVQGEGRSAPRAESCLNSRYTFGSFVVGSSNRLAHAAALAVAEKPGKGYNPLFIHGGVGLGKTHLLHAIGHECLARGLVVRYVTSEEFTNDLIAAIRAQTQQALRDKYRTIDVLLVDDIQFIAGKESTQEEFFHTFNALHGNDRQIVLTSDRPPRAMVTLEERLRSRFEWGMIADIQPPDYETRLAILHAKSAQRGAEIPPEALDLIARRVQNNIRELEGTLTRLLAFSSLSGHPVNVQMTESTLLDASPHRPKVTLEQVVEAVAQYYEVEMKALIGRSRARAVALPRQVAMFLARHETGASLPQIGAALGGRDHTTVMHGCDKIATMAEEDEQLRRHLATIKAQLYQGQPV